MAEGDMEVVLKDDEEIKGGETKTKAADGATADLPGDKDGTDVVDGVDELKRRLDEAEAGRVAAERRAEIATRRATMAEGTAHGSQMAVINNALETLNANADIYEQQMTDALAAGDFKLHSQISRKLSDETARKIELEKGKAALEAQAKMPRQEATPEVPTDAQKVESYVRNMQPRAAAWIRAHSQYVTDDKLNDALLEAHYAAKRQHAEGTDAYFDVIETKLNMRGNGHAAPAAAAVAQPDPTSAAAQTVSRRDDVQPPPAPTSRGGSPRRVTLTKAEQEAAEMSGLSYEEYARNMDREKKAGTLVYTHNQRRH